MLSSRSRGTDSGFGEYLEPCKSIAETGVQLVPPSPNIPAQPYADQALADQFKKIRHLVTNHVEIYYKNTKRLEFLPLEPSQLSYFLQRYITAWIVALIQKELKQGSPSTDELKSAFALLWDKLKLCLAEDEHERPREHLDEIRDIVMDFTVMLQTRQGESWDFGALEEVKVETIPSDPMVFPSLVTKLDEWSPHRIVVDASTANEDVPAEVQPTEAQQCTSNHRNGSKLGNIKSNSFKISPFSKKKEKGKHSKRVAEEDDPRRSDPHSSNCKASERLARSGPDYVQTETTGRNDLAEGHISYVSNADAEVDPKKHRRNSNKHSKKNHECNDDDPKKSKTRTTSGISNNSEASTSTTHADKNGNKLKRRSLLSLCGRVEVDEDDVHCTRPLGEGEAVLQSQGPRKNSR